MLKDAFEAALDALSDAFTAAMEMLDEWEREFLKMMGRLSDTPRPARERAPRRKRRTGLDAPNPTARAAAPGEAVPQGATPRRWTAATGQQAVRSLT